MYLGSSIATDIEQASTPLQQDAVQQIYSLTGTRLGQMSQHGFYIIRQGSKSKKIIVR